MSIHKLRTELGHHIKWVLGLVALTVVVGAFYQFGPSGGGPNNGAAKENDVIATVNGIEVQRAEFENMWERTREQYEQMGVQSPFMFANVRSMLFSQLLQSKLMLAAAQEQNVPVSDKDVNKQVDEQVTQFLEQDRQNALGKLSKEQMKVNPRDDKDYAEELSRNGTSVAQRIEYAKQMISADQIRMQLALQGLDKMVRSSVKPVSDADIKASYNEYKATLILLPKAPGAPKEQLKKKADSIRKEAVGGADFKALAKANDQSGFKNEGSQITYSFDSPGMPEEVSSELKKLQPGQISPVIDADYGYVIVKLDSVTPKLPKTLDKKTMDARRKAITDDLQQKAMAAFQAKVTKTMKVDVKDPELRAYWTLTDSQKYMGSDQAKYQQMKNAAIASLKSAVAANENNLIASAKLAELYYQDAKYKDAAVLLSGMLTDLENAELRKMLGDVQVKLGAKDKALENYSIASDMAAKNNPDLLRQLSVSYTQMGRKDLAKATDVKLAEYEKLRAQYEAQQKENAPETAPAAPSKP